MTSVSEPVPSVSVVIASIVGAPFIDDCLRSIEAESRALGAEVIVVACGPASYAARLTTAFPWVRVVHREVRETVPTLRRHGVAVARGEIVAIIEEHCVAAPDWLHVTLAAFRSGDHVAVGGPVVDHDYDRVRDWVVYFIEYNVSLPPVPAGPTTFLNGANIAYRRSMLTAMSHLLDDGYWEATLHPVLLREGRTLLSVPQMIVRHRGPFDYGYYLQQRYWFSRAFAGSRRASMSLGKRLVYTLASPLLPAVLIGRIFGRVWSKRCHVGRFVQALPLVVPAITVYVVGEVVGYLAGPGDALTKVE